MALLPLDLRRSRVSWLTAVCLVAAIGGWFATPAQAQRDKQAQESGLLDRLEHPDRTLHYSPADKSFETSSNVTGKQAAVRPFAFSRPATLRAGDGAFSTRAYSGRDAFRTKDFTTRRAIVVGNGFAQTDKQFTTKGFDTREDRAVSKSALPVRDYVPGGKPYLIPGKRQDTIDELRQQKNLTVDQVREILNKNK